jgi:hypothetical protein
MWGLDLGERACESDIRYQEAKSISFVLPAKREFLRADIRYQEAKKRRSDEHIPTGPASSQG